MPRPARGSISSYLTTFAGGFVVGSAFMASPAIGLLLAAICAAWIVRALAP